jgi:beta-lactamase class A
MINRLPAIADHGKRASLGARLRRGVVLPALLLLAPCSFAAERVCDLAGAQDPALQAKLHAVADEQGLGPAAKRGDLAVSLLILSDPDRPRLAQINGNEMLYAASLPKIAILLGAAVAIEEGQLVPDPALKRDIQNMIRYSCNDCATRVLRQVGHDQLLDILRRPQYAFYDPQLGGGLWVGKEYGPRPAYRRDPLHNISHGATVFEVSRFYCALQRDELVSPEQDQMMLEALSKPGIHHKFVKALAKHDELELYRKSGSWKTFHADSALVRDGDQAYVMVALAHSPQGSKWLERLAEPLRRLAKNQSTALATGLSSAAAPAANTAISMRVSQR